MPAQDIHSCSWFCELPNCVKAQRDELRQRVVELERDAARYRWLRNQPRKLPAGQSGIMACKWEADGTGFDLVKSELDAAIDAARKE